ncbi:MAG: bifunctional diaminohydroxyphosphoribosylaminopyrimidine deaminase/5-amino-6-(5-phosphoribosylamino)uracil reductase RibD [Chloroflexi bacterium]|nr:bifunctional diaminohydroxyphosphoribosylaminopyrimidine deaminase/5-amino-6-(5-phosphoribosylamino)uracil reductase RibD [Chloroflexota bacterium]
MREALAAAESARGWSSPNPPVGAVLVADGVTIGRGHTRPPGGDHAEIVALAEAGERARGATAYVTLEPCAHHGRTPPCADALIAAGVRRVEYALADPDPRVDGRGAEALRSAGIEVASGDGAQAASEQLAGYLTHRRTGRPRLVAKFVASLDGRIASATGDSRWLSGPETLEWAHRERPGFDAIVVGSGTVVLDDPELTARPGGSTAGAHQPLRVVVDTRGRTPAGARVLSGPPPTLVATAERSPGTWREAMREAGADVVLLPESDGRVDPAALLDELGRRGALTALVEGGGILLGSLFDRRLVDYVHAVITPIVVGARSAPAAVAGRGARRLADAPRLAAVRVEQLGVDVRVSGVPTWPEIPSGPASGGGEER